MGSIFSPSEDGWSRDSECCALSSVCLFGIFCCLCFPSPSHHPPRLRSLPLLFREEALSSWFSGHNSSPPAAALCSQKSWDSIRYLAVFNSLLESASDPPSHARLLACCVRESGAWLDVLPSSSLGPSHGRQYCQSCHRPSSWASLVFPPHLSILWWWSRSQRLTWSQLSLQWRPSLSSFCYQWHHPSRSSSGQDPFSSRAHQLVFQWHSSRWYNTRPLGKRQMFGLGRHLLRHPCSFVSTPFLHTSWCCGWPSRGEKTQKIQWLSSDFVFLERVWDTGCHVG